MPDPTPTPDPKETTEAKLCAYLEGELPESERAEIEQHLLANPQHRQLLADLAKTREWMRAIPPESSPVDLAELFQGQAERSMLLDDPDAGRSRMMTRWPQLAMLAALVLLTVGLGVLVVAMLKGPKNGSSKAFSLGPAVATTTMPADLDSRAPEPADKPAVAHTLDEPLGGMPAAQLGAVPAAPVVQAPAMSLPAVASVDAAKAETNLPADTLAASAVRQANPDLSDAAVTDELKAKLLEAGYRLPTEEKSVGFLVRADAPADSIAQLQGFFSRHQLAFDNPPAASNAVALADRLVVPAVVTPSASPRGAPPAIQALAMKTGGNEMAFARMQNAQNAQLQPFQNSSPVVLSNSQPQTALNGSPPTTGPVTAGIPAPILPAIAPPSQQAIYVAHGLTPLELELLSASLETSPQNQQVRRVALSDGVKDAADAGASASLPSASTGAIAKGQMLSVTVAELVGPGIEKTNVVKVGDDGTIALPMIDPIPAAGALPAELQQRIADKYKDANLIPQATVTVASATPTTTPTTQPMVAVTQPATQPVVAPAIAATQPVEQAPGIAVVVLVEKTGAVSPAK